ncbi:hypothetical protein POM88_037154 [Heracleum sosnowskyi]|uniref:Uncharacterized protein n=1 Tax=Heracleum sosnowskyi TaxID=360622 RepID=A0AAD8HPL3_9APIA|nr:hypothetical protein POM88_037154 [Heracleum sosnowskyi]
MANFDALSRGISSYDSSMTCVISVEVSHFEMKEDPSFWMDHNVQLFCVNWFGNKNEIVGNLGMAPPKTMTPVRSPRLKKVKRANEEVANVLGISMGDLDVDFKVFYSKITKSSQFPESLFKLRRDVLNVKLREPVTTEHHKSLIEGMEVEEEGHKKLFVQLLNLYYIEQFALCGTKLQKPRPTSWNYVSDVDEFNKVNWASAIHELLMKSIEEAQLFLVGGRLGQNTFRGCAPVLEVRVCAGKDHRGGGGGVVPRAEVAAAGQRRRRWWRRRMQTTGEGGGSGYFGVNPESAG